MLASLDHVGIVKVLRSFEAFGTAYFVMPFVEGVTLDELHKERRDAGEGFSEDELRGMLERVLDGLAHLHDRGIYHRDIKPGNILVTSEGVPVLIDFGSARQRLSERSMTVVESAGYTPFEQLQSRGNVGPWSDLYALAATLVKVMTGEAPPKAMDRMRKDPLVPLVERSELRSQYSEYFLRTLGQALAVDEGERWQDARIWKSALVVPTPQVIPRPPEPSPQTKLAGEECDIEIAPGVKLTMCWIPAGEFVMGSPAGEAGRGGDETQHRVRISKGFWLAKTETTQAQWQAVMAETTQVHWQAVMGNALSYFKSYFKRGDFFISAIHEEQKIKSLPVKMVSWYAAQKFIEKVNKGSGIIASGWKMTLPTEAQWEYAARAGEPGPYSGGTLDQVGWYEENSGGKTHAVGGKKPNGWGLHDMHGNVWEWCSDWYGEQLANSTDPRGSASGTYRVVRGGSWNRLADYCRVAFRNNRNPSNSNSNIGFRVACSSVQ